MKKGDIVLIPFPFSDLSGTKFRPALILFVNDDDVTVCFITSQTKWLDQFDIFIKPSIENGLKKDSILRLTKIATLERSLIVGKLGCLEMKYVYIVIENFIKLIKS